MVTLRAAVVGSLGGRRWGYTQDLGDGRLLLQSHDGSHLCVTDSRLKPIWDCEIPPSRGCHSVASDLSRIAVSLPEEVRLLNSAGQIVGSFSHAPWDKWSTGACAFDRGGSYLWATVPTSEDTDLVVLELDGLRELDRGSLQSQPAGLQPLHHPDGRNIGWSIGEGQDRALIRWSSMLGNRMQLRLPLEEDRVLTAIHPAGSEYITTPHATGPLQRHRFVDDAVASTIDAPDQMSWDFVAGYLDPDRILASTHTDDEEGLMVVNRDPMKISANVIPEGSVNQWSSLMWVGHGGWVTVGDEAAELWGLIDDSSDH